MKAYIRGISYYLPEQVLTNEGLTAEFPEWDVDKVYNKVGVRERHIAASDETAGDMAEKAARTRKCLPEGTVFRPPRIFPHDPIPDDQPVPLAPEVYRRFKKLQPEELNFDAEHQLFVLPQDYLSPDGKMDSGSIVWDHDHKKVTRKFVGEEPVTWDFKQYTDPAEVTAPDDWCVRYHRRLFLQEAAAEEGPP